MLDHLQDPLQQAGMGRSGCRRGGICLFEHLPLPLHGGRIDPRPIPHRQPLGSELQIAGMHGINRPERDEGAVDFGTTCGRKHVGLTSGSRGLGDGERMLRNVLEECGEGPLVGVADLLELGEADVPIDAVHYEIQQHGNRQRIRQADQQQAAGDWQVFEETHHANCPRGIRSHGPSAATAGFAFRS